ncbi:winged helix-turn-helix domain-containing protein [Methanococcus voltae]|uniref:DNA-binding transcriptional ArsR family regulator n=1 Tax=Methanococcus voltae TaxID=2188 RepID=A0A8J7URV0_METVO|nr:winged helix-turn-helix domain-containing protein [Methanococcus voltae]MBP2172061.1 DNA-binding transcriptional ArsR family regulator [Methanococcus voltae]MBP2200982.1 DNA-binding transcriptional ArsR family regulator [Methanococcus voltae]
MQIEIDKKVIKALSARSRIKILKKLNQKRYTVTELSKTLNLSKSTVHEHLSIMLDGGLVEKHDDGHKWIYYGMTSKGKLILNSQFEKTIVLFPLSVFAFVSGFYSLFIYGKGSIVSPMMARTTAGSYEAVENSANLLMAEKAMPVTETMIHHDPANLIIGLILLGIAFFMMNHIYQTYKNAKVNENRYRID